MGGGNQSIEPDWNDASIKFRQRKQTGKKMNRASVFFGLMHVQLASSRDEEGGPKIYLNNNGWNVSKFAKIINLQIQKFQQISSKRNMEEIS